MLSRVLFSTVQPESNSNQLLGIHFEEVKLSEAPYPGRGCTVILHIVPSPLLFPLIWDSFLPNFLAS